MAKTQTAPVVVEPAGWAPLKLVGLGIVTLLVALSIIISLGARLGGCMYLDGSRGAHGYDKHP